MAQKKNGQNPHKKRSKREKRIKFVIYLMIAAMLMSSLLAGASFFL